MNGGEDRLPGGTLARIARWLAPPEVYRRVLVPLLADYQFEHSRAAGALARARVQVIWLLAFWWSLAVEGVRATRLHLGRNAWGTTEGERAAARLFLRCITLAAVWIVLLLVLHQVRRHPYAYTDAGTLVLLQLPGMLGFALPVACVLGVLVASHRRAAGELRLRSIAGMAALAGVVTFANLGWLTPEANFAYKNHALENALSRLGDPGVPVTVSRGDREMSVHQLAVRAADLRARARSLEAAHYELELHKKPALGAWCLVLALLGATVARSFRRPTARWIAALAACWIWYAVLRLGERAADAGQVPAALAMWTPVLAATSWPWRPCGVLMARPDWDPSRRHSRGRQEPAQAGSP